MYQRRRGHLSEDKEIIWKGKRSQNTHAIILDFAVQKFGLGFESPMRASVMKPRRTLLKGKMEAARWWIEAGICMIETWFMISRRLSATKLLCSYYPCGRSRNVCRCFGNLMMEGAILPLMIGGSHWAFKHGESNEWRGMRKGERIRWKRCARCRGWGEWGGGKVLWVVNESPLLELCQRHTVWEGDKWLISGYRYRTNLLLLPRRVVTSVAFVCMHCVKLNVKKGVEDQNHPRYAFHEAITRPLGKCAVPFCIYMFSKSAYSLSHIYTCVFMRSLLSL